MSDAFANYENTKRTAPIPAGWMLTEPQNITDPSCAQFWNPMDQCWLGLTVDAQGQPCEEFVKFWNGGATCLVVKDPNYIAPPPPTNFEAFAPPFAVPQVPSFTAPTVSPVPVVPVVPVVAPVVAVAPVVQPAPIPVVQPQVVIPQAQPAPILVPVAPAAPVAAAPAQPVGIQADEDEDDTNAQVSAADPNEVAAWLAARDGVLAQMKALKEVEDELRKRIVKVCFPDGLHEGSNKCMLPDGRKLTVTGVVNRTVDDALVPAALDSLQKHLGIAPTGLFRTKYEVGTAVLRTLGADAKNLLANVITEKQGAPQLKVTEAK